MITLGKDAIIIIAVCVPLIAILIVAVIVVSVLGFSQDHQQTVACQNDNGPAIIGSGSTIDWQSAPARNGVLSGDGTRFFYFTTPELDKIYTFKTIKSGGLVLPVFASEGSGSDAFGSYSLSCSYDGSILGSYSLSGVVSYMHVTTVKEDISTQTILMSEDTSSIGGVCTSSNGEHIAVGIICLDPSDPDRRITGSGFVRKVASNYVFNGFVPGITILETIDLPSFNRVSSVTMTSDGVYCVCVLTALFIPVASTISIVMLYKRNIVNNAWTLVKTFPLPTITYMLFRGTSYVSNNDPRFPDGTLVFMVSNSLDSFFVYTFSNTESIDVALHQTIKKPTFVTGSFFCLDFSVSGDPCIQYLYISTDSNGFLFCKMDPQTLLFSDPELVNMLQPHPPGGVISSTHDGSMLVTSVISPNPAHGRLQIFTN